MPLTNFGLESNPTPTETVPAVPHIMAPLPLPHVMATSEEGYPMGIISLPEHENGSGLVVQTSAFGLLPPSLSEHEYMPLVAHFQAQNSDKTPKTVCKISRTGA